MSRRMNRVVIASEWKDETDGYPRGWSPLLDLPDAEHVHVTRHPDGTYTAVPMKPAPMIWTGYDGEVLALDPWYVEREERNPKPDEPWAWVDAPVKDQP
jgi:hypothetical protein